MKKALRILILICIFVLLAASVCCADSVPNYPGSDDYHECAIFLNGEKLGRKAALIKGNIYVDIETLQSIGDTQALSFDTESMICRVDASKLNAFFGDEETTRFIKTHAGSVELPIKYFHTSFDETNRYYISLELVGQISRLSWTYKDDAKNKKGSVYIIPYSSFEGTFGIASGNESVVSGLESGGKAASFRENELLRIDNSGSTDSYYKVLNAAGETFYVNKSDLELATDPSQVYSFSRKYKKEDSFSEPINAMWSDLTECPAKIAGLDVIADHSIDQKDQSDGSCSNYSDYGIIQSAHAVGYKWWICAMDFNTANYGPYHNANLKSRAAANKTAAQYLLIACLYNADGLNIDYEGLSGIRNYYIYFVQTLCRHADKLGITMSVCTYYDNGNFGNNDNMYPLDIFGQCCDFVCEMTYDNSTVGASSGSVMPKWWWQDGTNFMASLMPKEKILMGIAYYSRTEFYAYGNWLYYDMWSNKGLYQNFTVDVKKWNENYGQYYIEGTNTGYRNPDGVLYAPGEMVITYFAEEERSSALKAQYIKDNHMGGTIGWMFNYVDPAYYPNYKKVFGAFNSIYHGSGSYSDYD